MAFHEGELAVQNRAGVAKMASRVGQSIRSTIPGPAQHFIEEQPYVFVSSVDANNRVWVSMLAGKPGFATAVGDDLLRLEANNIDPLFLENIEINPQVGLIAIEFETRRRMRVNGRAWVSENTIFIRTEEVFSNCPRYIQARYWEETDSRLASAVASQSAALTETQTEFIRQADTFIIGTSNTARGADASHRGGLPGFVHVATENKLVFPDYNGNTMFQTLGNIELNPNSGLLFIDFTTGRQIQLSGKAKIIWDADRLTDFAGAERIVEFEIEQVREIGGGGDLKWSFIDYSPFNPK